MIHAFIYGVILAFGLIMPLGIQNIFIFNQGATQRHFLHALPCVITAAICDSLLIILAVLGVSVAVLSLAWLKEVIFFIGFFFLLYMGWHTWKSEPARLDMDSEPLSDRRQIGFAISVSILNPHAIIDSVAVIGTNSLHFSGDSKWAFTLACIIVSCCWFFGMAVAGHFIHRMDKTGRVLILINKLSALIIWSVAAYLGWLIVSMIL